MSATAGELLEAASAALAAGDVVAAEAAARASLAVGELAGAHWLLGGVLFLDDRLDEARTAWEAAFRGFRDEGRSKAAARAAMALADLCDGGFRQPTVGRGWLERARRLLDEAGPCVEQGYLELAVMACDRVDLPALLTSADRALEVAVEHGDHDLEAQALADGGLALVSMGRATEGFARLDAAMVAVSAGEVSAAAAGVCFCAMLTACDRAGDAQRAAAWSQVVSDTVDAFGGRPRALHAHCRLAYGSVLSLAGRWDEAEALFLAALGPAEAPTLSHRALTVAHLASIRLEQGRLDEAVDLLEPFEDWVQTCGPLGRAHLARGELDRAAAVLRRGLDELVGDALRRAPLLATSVEVEVARGDAAAAGEAAAALRDLAAGADVAALAAEAALADARVASIAAPDADGVVAAYRRAKALVDDGRPLQLGRVRLELARVLAGQGDTPGAVAEARAARAAFERLGAVPCRDEATALLRELGDHGQPRPRHQDELAATLTRREQEVLGLVAEGLTNARIAERLYISPKTAEHHVGRVLSKLGVRSRAEAAALAVRLAATTPTGDGGAA